MEMQLIQNVEFAVFQTLLMNVVFVIQIPRMIVYRIAMMIGEGLQPLMTVESVIQIVLIIINVMIAII